VIAASCVCQKPSDEALGAFLDPLNKIITAAGNPDKRSPFVNHLQAFSDTIQALGWVMQPGPVPAIQNQGEAASLYTTKILMAVKEKPEPERAHHRAFVAALKALVAALAEYAKEHFNMGLTWKRDGILLKDFK